MPATCLTIGYVPGAAPAKWARIFSKRYPGTALTLLGVAAAGAAAAVRSGTVDAALLRLPVDTSGLAVIPLYEETTVAVVPTGHLFTAAHVVTAADLAAEPLLVPRDDVVGWADAPAERVVQRPATTSEAVELAAAGIGLVILPQSLARLHHRRDLTYRPVTDAPSCPVALVFPEGPQSEFVEWFVGIVRGRTPGSSRGPAEPAPKRTAREKTLAKQSAREAAGKVARKPGRGRH